MCWSDTVGLQPVPFCCAAESTRLPGGWEAIKMRWFCTAGLCPSDRSLVLCGDPWDFFYRVQVGFLSNVSSSMKGAVSVGNSSASPEFEQGGRGGCRRLKGSVCYSILMAQPCTSHHVGWEAEAASHQCEEPLQGRARSGAGAAEGACETFLESCSCGIDTWLTFQLHKGLTGFMDWFAFVAVIFFFFFFPPSSESKEQGAAREMCASGMGGRVAWASNKCRCWRKHHCAFNIFPGISCSFAVYRVYAVSCLQWDSQESLCLRVSFAPACYRQCVVFLSPGVLQAWRG